MHFSNKDDSSVAISDVIAKRVFGDENPIGKQITCLDHVCGTRCVSYSGILQLLQML
jgi:hypothetical protein